LGVWSFLKAVANLQRLFCFMGGAQKWLKLLQLALRQGTLWGDERDDRKERLVSGAGD
jgi:hypothetical protein